MRELFINSQLVDIDEETKINLEFVSCLTFGIGAYTAPRSWTVSLPKTTNNKKIIDGACNADYSGTFPYRKYTVDYYENSVKIIDSGNAVLLKVSDKIEFCFVFGSIFEKLKSLSEKLLTELTETESDAIDWNNTIDYSAISGVCWRNWFNYTNKDRTYTSHADIPYCVSHPVVTFAWLVERIGTEFDIDLSSLSALQTASVPLKSAICISSIGKTDEYTFASTTLYGLLFTYSLPDEYNFINIKGSNNELLKIMLNEIGQKSVIKFEGTCEHDGVNQFLELYKNGSLIQQFAGEVSGGLIEYTFSYETEFYGNDEFYFRFDNVAPTNANLDVKISHIYNQSFYNKSFFIIPNLPKIKCSDFIFDCCVLAGVFPTITATGEITFFSLQDIYDNISSAYDWTNRLKKTQPYFGEVSDIEFKFGNYQKKNYLKYIEDVTNPLDTSAFLQVDNDNLDETADLATLHFKAGKRFSELTNTIDYPLYDISLNLGVLSREIIEQDADVIGEISGTMLDFTDDLKFSAIKATANYTAYQNIIYQPKLLKDEVYLKASDIVNLDLTKPVYFNQYGKYYAITKLTFRQDDFSDVELLEL